MGQSYVLVAVETAHIQSYIFASNRLKENVGASYLVAVATREWAFETLSSQGLRTNLTFMNNERGFSNQRIEENQLDAEVLYSGGGNIVILFSEASETVIEPNKLPEAAISRKFIRILSRRIQLEAPGLTLTFSAHPFKWEDSLSKAVSTILRDMTYQRNYQTAAYGEGGQSVQMMDSSTGLPAITMQKETRSPDDERPNPWQPYGAETVAKRDSAEPANKLLRSQLQLEQTEYRFALDLDDLGRSKDDTSYIAVVHADGNGLGRLIQGLQEDFPAPKNRKYIEYMRWFSESVRKVAQAAQQEMAAQLLKSIKHSDGRYYLEVLGRKTKEIFLFERDGKPIFPLRPLVSGGDDVTFVCDGRIALDLAVIFLKAFEKYSIEILKRPLTACAGIAIVKTHYPFARAYELAEELASEAKQARHLLDENNAPSAMDWHITAGGLYGDLDMMRKREYQVSGNGNLTLRPIFIADWKPEHPQYYRSWDMMRRVITEFQIRWQDNQNKAESLREILRKGEVETEVFKLRYLTTSKKAWSVGKPPYLPEVAGFERNGWHNGYCGYYDALELMDKYIPLQTQELS